MTHTGVAPFSHQSPILGRLMAEWQHRTIRAADLRHVRGWDLPGDEIDSLDDVLHRCGFVRVDDARATGIRVWNEPTLEMSYDAYSLHLLVLARTDELAGRIVLQRILPAPSGIARRHIGSGGALHDLLDDLVANAWPTIRCYPVDRRPHRVVANLVRDVAFQTLVRPARRLNAAEVPMTHDRMGDVEAGTSASPLIELIELLDDAQQAGALSTADRELIRQLIELGRPEHLAAVRHVSARTIRNHRDAIIHRLRNVATAA